MERFKGGWVSTKAENFDAFLKALGASLLARGTAKAITPTLDISFDGECTFIVKSISGPISREKEFKLGDIKEDNWAVGGPVVGGWSIEDDDLVGKFTTKDNKEVIIKRSIEEDMLVQRMSVGTVSATRWFKRK